MKKGAEESKKEVSCSQTRRRLRFTTQSESWETAHSGWCIRRAFQERTNQWQSRKCIRTNVIRTENYRS